MIVRIPLKIFILRIHLSMLRFYHLQCFILNACRVAVDIGCDTNTKNPICSSMIARNRTTVAFWPVPCILRYSVTKSTPSAIANSITATLPNA